MTKRSTTRTVASRSAEDFIDVVTTNIQFSVDNYDGADLKRIDSAYAELIAYQAACWFAQRLDDGVGTGETLEALKTDRFMSFEARRKLVEKYLEVCRDLL